MTLWSKSTVCITSVFFWIIEVCFMAEHMVSLYDEHSIPGTLECFFFNTGISVQFSCSVMSDSLWPHELQHARLPCPSPTPRAYSNSCPLYQWCHPTISPSLAFSLSQHQGLFKSVLRIRWPKYWSFSFSISPFSEYSGLISFRMDMKLYLLLLRGATSK